MSDERCYENEQAESANSISRHKLLDERACKRRSYDELSKFDRCCCNFTAPMSCLFSCYDLPGFFESRLETNLQRPIELEYLIVLHRVLVNGYSPGMDEEKR